MARGGIFVLLYVLAAILHPNYADKPANNEWIIDRDPSTKTKLAEWLVTGCWSTKDSPCAQAKEPRPAEYSGFDGWYNNIAHPELGAVDTALLRRTPAVYEDSVYKPVRGRPNPLTLSEELLKGDIGTKSRTGKTALLVFFGQQTVEEILDAQRPACPPEYFNIHIPDNHEYRLHKPNHTELPFLRTRYDMRTGFSPNNPRQQLNEITPWLDGGLTYGTTKAWADQLRRMENGTLAPHGQLASVKDEGFYPAYNNHRLPLANPPPPANHSKWIKDHETANVDRFFKLGNPRGNENPFLLSFGVLWFRWHNVLAKMLHLKYPKWTDEKVFNEARKWLIATHQQIVVYEWLPAWLGDELGDYKGYDPSVDPQIDQLFQTSAMRFGHTLVTPGVYMRDYADNGCKLIENQKIVRTCNFFWRPQEPLQLPVDSNIRKEGDIDRLLMGMAYQLAEAEDHTIVEDLRGRVFGPLEFSRRDLMAVNVQRGRDHGIPDFNTAREAFNLPRYSHVENFTFVSEEKRKKLKELYNHGQDHDDAWLSRIDVWIGGIMETGDTPGELFRTIIKDQFLRIRNADRFWFENKQNKLFTDDEIERIKNITLRDIIMSVTQMKNEDMQMNPFQAPTPEEIPVNCRQNKDLQTGSCSNATCRHFSPLTSNLTEKCIDAGTYDYFSNSETSYILTFAGLGTITAGMVGTMFILSAIKNRKKSSTSFQQSTKVLNQCKNISKHLTYTAFEWLGKEGYNQRILVLDRDMKHLQVRCPNGNLLHNITLKMNTEFSIFKCSDNLHIMIRTLNIHDLILKFETLFMREKFLNDFYDFLQFAECNSSVCPSITLKAMLGQAVTKNQRKKKLEEFFKIVLSHFESKQAKSSGDQENIKTDNRAVKDAVNTELTISEFAEYFTMRSDSEFVTKMFNLVDKDKNGFISFREFCDLFVIFKNGTADEKGDLLFDMYDIDGNGELTMQDFLNLLRSLLDIAKADVEDESLETVINSMVNTAGVAHKQVITKEDFRTIMRNQKHRMSNLNVNVGDASLQGDNSRARRARDTIMSIYGVPAELTGESSSKDFQIISDEHADPHSSQELKGEKDASWLKTKFTSYKRSVENYQMHIFWLAIYTMVLLSIFAERAYYYSVEREHAGLRQIAGYGVTVTRGAASAMMFTYSTLLITMCRNTITYMRETWLHRVIPFDSAVEMHKFIAIWAIFFTIIHCIGHGINFYHISTQTSNDLTCLFRNFFHSTHEIPKFHYWCWQTMTGVTGMLLVTLTALIYIFASRYARRHLHNWFWFTHGCYPIFYALIILHGAARLVQEPYFHYFFLGPCVLFVLDTLVSMSRKKVKIPVLKAELLPSEVTNLVFLKPANFNYKSGQWVRIACPELNSSEYHPFTLSSAPNESTLSLHIRAVGPWTWNLRRLYDPGNLVGKPLPKIYIDGPYGESHQDWNTFDVSVLVGGGIGVTPFASILKDIVFNANAKNSIRCKKVYFFWVTKTQKHFEWLVDIIRELEKADTQVIVSVHIFVTQFFEKFDMRTMLLYICERHFQRACGKSLFTGLKARTHFGRPNFDKMFSALAEHHSTAQKIGVFSCGPPAMTHAVGSASNRANQNDNGPVIEHHFENF